MSCLHVQGLTVEFPTPTGALRAADEVCLYHRSRETLALIGETGCGKSVVGAAIAGLLPENASVRGRVEFLGRNLLELTDREMASLRGREITIVLQNPALALNPILRIGRQIGEPLAVHLGMRIRDTLPRVRLQLERLGFLDVERRLDSFPFQLSGGMCQRVLVAAAMALTPRILIADEPTKGLDAPLRDMVRSELRAIKETDGTSILLITHDVALARGIAERAAVMYGGQIVETGPAGELFSDPGHPYTRALLMSLPENGFRPIGGPPLDMTAPPEGCLFHPRCAEAGPECRIRRPELRILGDRGVRCPKRS